MMSEPTSALLVDPAEALDFSSESIILRDPEGRIIGWNGASERLYGWSRDDVIGADADELLNSRPKLAIGADGLPAVRALDVTRFSSNRSLVLVEARFTPHFDAANQLRYVVEASRDVTAERARAQATRSNEHRYRSLFHAMAAAFIELDIAPCLTALAPLLTRDLPDLRAHLLEDRALFHELLGQARIVEVNDRVVEIFGAKGDPFPADLTAIWGDESHDVFVDTLLAQAAGTRRLTREIRLHRLNGEPVFGIYTACLAPEIVGEGRVMIGIVETTELRAANEAAEANRGKFRALFQSMPIGLCLVNGDGLSDYYAELGLDPDADLEAYFEANPQVVARVGEIVRIEEANPRAARLLGARSCEELIGRSVGFVWKDSPKAFRNSIISGIRKAPIEEEVRIHDLHGNVVEILFSCARLEDPKHRWSVVGMVDVRDRIAAQAALDTMRAEFAHSTRISLLGELSASIAHEISQPLAAIATNGQTGLRWLEREQPDYASAVESFGRIVSSAARAKDIITRVRGMASGRKPVLSETNLTEIVSGALPLVEGQARAQRIEIELVDESSCHAIRVDRTQIEQVIVNILVNAMQVIETHGAPVRRIEVRIIDERDQICCAISDSGPGLPHERIHSVFERFVSTKADGMGLGLALCRSIIDAHEGEISASNASPLGGAQFKFYLPATFIFVRPSDASDALSEASILSANA